MRRQRKFESVIILTAALASHRLWLRDGWKQRRRQMLSCGGGGGDDSDEGVLHAPTCTSVVGACSRVLVKRFCVVLL